MLVQIPVISPVIYLYSLALIGQPNKSQLKIWVTDFAIKFCFRNSYSASKVKRYIPVTRQSQAVRGYFIFSSFCAWGPLLPLAWARRKHLCRKAHRGSSCFSWAMPKSKTKLSQVNIGLPGQFHVRGPKGSVTCLTWRAFINHMRVPRN